jgi:CRP-like cAMP-binding protein
VNHADELATVPLFDCLSEDERAEIGGWFELKRASKGAVLTGQGASGYSFFVLIDGTAAVTVAGESVGTLSAGDFFGEVAILDGGRRTATVTARSEVAFLALFGTDFRRLQTAFPEVADRLETAMHERLAAHS